ncbi:hypothetical protein D3C86_1478720 [compost metagenome]
MAKPRTRKPATQIIVDEVDYTSAPEEAVAPVLPSILVTIERAADGRITVRTPGQPGRIAGSDEALPETLRQLGLDIVKRKLV